MTKANMHINQKYDTFPDLYESSSMNAIKADTKSPGTNRFCPLCLSVFSKAIMEYDMMEVEKCTTTYIESIIYISQSAMRGSPYWDIE